MASAQTLLSLAYSPSAAMPSMDETTKALCYKYRHPPPGQEAKTYEEIAQLVLCKDRKTHPTKMGVWKAVQGYGSKKKRAVGRPKGAQQPPAKENKVILKAFHKKRPPGHGVDARDVHDALPKKLRAKTSLRTVIRRLADKGYHPQTKIQKDDPPAQSKKKRWSFGKRHVGKSRRQWVSALQAVGDIKDFTYYPKSLQARFKRYRSRWTYMTDAERQKPAFARPKRWFSGKDWKKTKKVKVLGMTSSNGKILALVLPVPFTAAEFAKVLRQKVVPWMRRAFPNKGAFQVLLDGEKSLHAPEAKAAMAEGGISVLPGWPARSPDLNPQENVWAHAEPEARARAQDSIA